MDTPADGEDLERLNHKHPAFVRPQAYQPLIICIDIYIYTYIYIYRGVHLVIQITHQGNFLCTGRLWTGPLWAPLGPCWLGPCCPPWALVCWALVGPPGLLWALWALAGSPGPLWAGPLWASQKTNSKTETLAWRATMATTHRRHDGMPSDTRLMKRSN